MKFLGVLGSSEFLGVTLLRETPRNPRNPEELVKKEPSP